MFNRVQSKAQLKEEKLNARLESVTEPMQKYDVRYPLPGQQSTTGRIIAIDCEMVQCEDKYGASVQKVARLSIVNYTGHVVLDQYYRPNAKITNYLTRVSGITYALLKDAPVYDETQKEEVRKLFKDKTIVGHSLRNDFAALELNQEEFQTRDIGIVNSLKSEQGRIQGLKSLCSTHLGQEIQNGSHCSVVDARAALFIYRKFRNELNYEYRLHKVEEERKKLLNKKKNDRKKVKKVCVAQQE